MSRALRSGRLARYMDAADPLDASANRVAMLVAASQPFYPLYLVFTAGEAAWAGALVWLTTPLFLLVPAANRRSAGAGRLVLAVAGTLVTLLGARVLGTASAVEVYYLPVVIVGVLLFRAGEGALRLMALALPVGSFLLLHGRLSAAGALPDAATAGRLVAVHVVGGLGLTTYVLWQAYAARRS